VATIEDRQFKSFVKQNNKWHRRTLENKDVSLYDSLDVSRTIVSTSPIKIDTPENTGSFFIVHKTFGATVYIGNEGVTVSTGFPLESGETLNIENFQRDNENEIYAVSNINTDLFCVGTYKL